MPKLTPAQLQVQIKQLKQENQQLRTLLKVILDTAYQAVNGPEKDEEEEKAC